MARSLAWWWPPPRSAVALASDRVCLLAGVQQDGLRAASWPGSLHSVWKGAGGQLGQAWLDLALQGIQSVFRCLEASKCLVDANVSHAVCLQLSEGYTVLFGLPRLHCLACPAEVG